MAEGTAALRAAAAHWSLSGDQQLLDILQNIHQRIITRCSETTAQLELMSKGLRDASVNLQNVNNKFLALSNTQFVESRVYDDDADLVRQPVTAKEPPQLTDLSSDLSKLKQSLQILESYHEPLRILRDSDSESDSDGGDDRLVLKPKDLYSDRPLPYIIGSQAWKSKWHAGLIQDESDSDSSTSKVEAVEQYSESDDEQTDRQIAREYTPARKQSSGSSSLQSEPAAVSVSPVRPSPSLVAAELARRLGGDARLPVRDPVDTEPDTPVRKLYKPQQTPSAQIFSDEPPPLDEASSDDDIFAELHKPHQNQRSNVQDALFDFSPKGNSLEEALFGRPPNLPDKSENRSQPPLFDDDLMPERGAAPEVRSPPEIAVKRDDGVKKPVGGISLFGTNKRAESIGAAILNRNRRTSSTSGDESNEEVKEVKEGKEVKKERDIFDDLFAKSEKLNKKSVKVAERSKISDVKPKEVKKDAFSDIFDDIDDIFSTDIVSVPIKDTKKDEKPLFDDDDLFAEVPKVANLGQDTVKIAEKGSFFVDNKLKTENVVRDSKANVIKDIKKESRSLFDSDSDDGLFTNVSKEFKSKVEAEKPVEYKISDDIFGDDDGADLFASDKAALNEKAKKSSLLSKVTEVSKAALFDSDDELFANSPKETRIFKEDTVTKKDSLSKEDDSLFVTEVKRPEKELKDGKSINDSSDLLENEKKSKALKVIESINNDIFNDGDNLFKKSETIKESKNETVHDTFDDEKVFATDGMFSKNSTENKQDTENTPAIEIPNDFESEPPEDIFNEPGTQYGNILRTTRIAADEENVQTVEPKRDIFNDSDEELFRSVPPAPILKEKELDKNDTLYQDIPKPQSAVTIRPETVKSDIFSDIFDDVPPIFEKPKEPKRSQNVNALYGDDSDDEALFFKKNDVISDEKPDFSPSGEIFGIFNDEPPALDVDFVQKPAKSDNLPRKVIKTEDFTPQVSDDSTKLDEKDNTTVLKETHDVVDNTSKEPKKVGKLKPMNFNINVNTLLPGASPKKKQVEDTDIHTASNEELHKTDRIEHKMVKSISFDDPEILDNKLSKERAKIQVKRRPSTRRARREAVRKSAIDLTDSSLDSSNDNSVKDEAKVVKTVYILNDDDIFGDSSKKVDFTESTKKHLNIVDSDEELFKKSEDKDVIDNKSTKEYEKESIDVVKLLKGDDGNRSFLDLDDDDGLFKAKDAKIKEPKENNENETKIEEQNENKSFLDSDDSDDLFKTNARIKTSNTSDGDLFKSNKNNEIKKEAATFLDSDDTDELFTTKTTKLTANTWKSNLSSDDEDLFSNAKKGIETLGKAYKNDTRENTIATANKQKEVHNVFDDFPPKSIVVEEKIHFKPQEIKPVKKVEKVVVKKSILDVSSDEDDLFKAKSKFTKKNDKSLFGDDNDDDDDLFGAKAVREPQQAGTTLDSQSTKEAKPAETVFVDPLSLFGDED